MEASPVSPSDELPSLPPWLVALVSNPWTHVLTGGGILLVDLYTGPYILFPIYFILPIFALAWFEHARFAYLLATLLPIGRFFIAEFVDQPGQPFYNGLNAMSRTLVLLLIAYLVLRTVRQSRELRRQVQSFITVCAWSRTVQFEGEWVSFEEYLQRRFNVNATHGISPAEAEKWARSVRELTGGRAA